MKLTCSLLFALTIFFGSNAMSADQLDVWVGTNGPNGIHHFVLDTNKGEMSEPTKLADQGGSGFVVIHPNGKTLYATGRRKGNVGFVASFSIVSETGTTSLKPLNTQDLGTSGASHINVDRSGKVLMTAQYGGSSIATFPILDDLTIGPISQLILHEGGSGVVGNRQDDPHPHWIGANPDNSIVCVPDLGLDQVITYKLDSANAKLTRQGEIAVAPGAGPRHMKFHDNKKWVYVLNELSMTISVFHFDASDGSFKLVQTIASLPDELKDKHLNSAAEIRIHPNGKFVYASSRGHDSISVYAIDDADGQLKLIQRESIRGSWPRNFNITPSGKWLLSAGAYSNTVSLFEIEDDGTMVFTRQIVNIPKPICVEFGVRN